MKAEPVAVSSATAVIDVLEPFNKMVVVKLSFVVNSCVVLSV